jgi:hypothetical protein
MVNLVDLRLANAEYRPIRAYVVSDAALVDACQTLLLVRCSLAFGLGIGCGAKAQTKTKSLG